MEVVFLGTTVKFSITGQDLSSVPATMEQCDFNVYAWANSKNTNQCTKPSSALCIPKSECVKKDSDNYIVEIPTSSLKTGYLVIRLEIQVLDEDCLSGYRNEVVQMVPNIQIV